MWRKATCYKSATLAATIAALVVASCLALLTGAKAETLNMNAFCCSIVYRSTGTPGSGSMTMFSSSIFGGPAGNNGGGGSAATFDGLTGGSFTLLGPGNPAIPGPTFSLGGFDPTTSTFTSVAPNMSTLTVSFPNNAGSLAGNVTVTSVQENASGTFAGPITAIGNFTETSGTGALGAAFANGGILDLPASISNCASPCSLTLANLFALPSGNNFTTLVNNGPILTPAAAPPEIPLPPAIYLFGSVLGGAFWLGRRKRSATPSGLAEV